MPKPPLIVAHRGGAKLAPENTLPAFLRAQQVGAPFIEIDVKLTKDGQVVCFHDDRLDRLTPAKGRVSEWDWMELSGIPVMPGSFGGAYPNARIPLLRTVLDSLSRPMQFVVEIKPDPERGEELVRKTLQAVIAANVMDRSRFISFSPDMLRQIRRERMPNGPDPKQIEMGVLVTLANMSQMIPLGKELQAGYLHAPYQGVNAEWLKEAHDGGFKVDVWTVNLSEEMQRMIDLGVDEITTDSPDIALQLTKGK